eukprot:15013830-Alexandrium_andersonii.AAC.1
MLVGHLHPVGRGCGRRLAKRPNRPPHGPEQARGPAVGLNAEIGPQRGARQRRPREGAEGPL